MPEEEITEETKHRHTVNAADAREQASEGRYSFLRSEFRVTKDGKETFEIPHKDLFDNDQQERWEELQHKLNRVYEREPDVKSADGTVIARGALYVPHCIDNGQLVKPTWPERLAIVLWGEAGAKRAKAGGINFNEIEVIWTKQELEMGERMSRDPKSAASDAGVAAAPDSD